MGLIASNITPTRFSEVTPGDTELDRCIGIRIGVAGSVIVEGQDGEIVTFASVAIGEVIPGQIKRVKAGGTAEQIIAFHI